MQPTQVLRTIRWIQSQLGEDLTSLLFLERSKERGGTQILHVSHDLGAASQRITSNPDAVVVLKAFGLELLMDRDKFIRFLIGRVEGAPDDERDASKKRPYRPEIEETTLLWHIMTGCVQPIEALTTPEELRGDQPPEDIITLELRRPSHHLASLTTIAKAATHLQDAYAAIARIVDTKDEGTLSVLHIESGSDIRIDCKGLGEPLKHLKELILEAWHKFRHKRAEEVLENNKAILASLAVMDHIAEREHARTLSREEAEQLRRRVLTSVSGLFECGALIAEIPEKETVENTQLLTGFSPKQLAPPKTPVQPKIAERVKTPRKRKPSRRSPDKT